jgi:hypothetical protein
MKTLSFKSNSLARICKAHHFPRAIRTIVGQASCLSPSISRPPTAEAPKIDEPVATLKFQLAQSQRDCITQPRVATEELPWEKRIKKIPYPNGVAADHDSKIYSEIISLVRAIRTMVGQASCLSPYFPLRHP